MYRIPIYQMVYAPDENGGRGLLFASEQELSNSQSILFTVPIIEPFLEPYDVVDYSEQFKFYFPFLLGEKYLELEAKVKFPEFVFSIPNTDYNITFEMDPETFYRWPYFRYYRRRGIGFRRLKYVGKFNQLFPFGVVDFLSLLPVDLFEMDELFLEHKGIFVGLTPTFGAEQLNSQKQ